MNVLILGLIAMYVMWRVKSEIRGVQWNQLSFAQRREIIQKLLDEAIELADWMFSNMHPQNPQDKRALGKKKLKVALQYGREQLSAMGATSQDRDTLRLRLEHLMATRNPSKIRFGATQPLTTTME